MPEINKVKTIGVISDTHAKTFINFIPAKLISLFQNFDLIIHAGDITHPDVITELETFAPVFGVRGNMDSFDIRFHMEDTLLINNKFKISVCHGAGSHNTTKSRMYKKFKKYEPDIIIFGHTHKAEIEDKDGIIMFNPGSATNGMLEQTIGMITVSKNELVPKIIAL